MQCNHTKSLRLPKSWDDFITKFANQWGSSASYVYRSAIREFIRKNQQGERVC